MECVRVIELSAKEVCFWTRRGTLPVFGYVAACEPSVGGYESKLFKGHHIIRETISPKLGRTSCRRNVRSPAHGFEGQPIRVILQYLQQVLFHVLEHEIQLPLSSKRLFQRHDVGMSQHA